MHYENKHDDLILSDIDEMRKVTPPQDKPGINQFLHFIRMFTLKIIRAAYYFQVEKTKR